MKNPSENTDPNQDLHDGMHTLILCIDYDGVIHQYSQGWKGPTELYDPPVVGAFDWLRALIADPRFEPAIYSSRSKYPEAVKAMKAWFKQHGLKPAEIAALSFPTEKPAAWLTIDDRCFLFRGQFPSLDFMASFAGWTKRAELVRQHNGDEPTDADFLRSFAAGMSTTEVSERLRRIADELEGRTT